MFFTRCAMVIAVLGLLGAAGQLYLGFEFAQKALEQQTAIGKSSGSYVDRAAYMFVFSLALGTLAEISFSVRKAITKDA